MSISIRFFPPVGAVCFGAHGLDCFTRHVTYGVPWMPGHDCGYVRIPADHPWAGLDADAIDVDVHGGLTFALDMIDGSTWVGWDDAHWTKSELPVRDETERLAAQIAAATAHPLRD